MPWLWRGRLDELRLVEPSHHGIIPDEYEYNSKSFLASRGTIGKINLKNIPVGTLEIYDVPLYMCFTQMRVYTIIYNTLYCSGYYEFLLTKKNPLKMTDYRIIITK